MLFKSLLKTKAQKSCTGVGKRGVCYLVGRKYYNSNGSQVVIY